MNRCKKVLILPQICKNINAGGQLAVVKKISDSNSKYFNYLELKHNLKNLFNKLLLKFLGKLRFLNKNSLINLIIFYLRIIITKNNLKNTIISYEFIISHDPICSFAVLKYFKNKKILNIYHGQGSIYNECTDLAEVKKSYILKKFLNNTEGYIYKNSDYIGFPSKGSIDALVKTHPELKDIIKQKQKNKRCFIFHNGIDINEKVTHNKILENEIGKNCYNFITVSSLNEAKGVDRIPKFLKLLKENKVELKWILIGDGITRDLVSKKIKEYDLKKEVIWFKQKFIHSDILGLLEKTDFYILFHKYSIFDLAILEAMSKGNVPVLSNIGGNKEMIINNNGLLLNNFGNITPFLNFIKKNDLNKLKSLNKEIIINNFNEKNFIKKYEDFVKSYCWEDF